MLNHAAMPWIIKQQEMIHLDIQSSNYKPSEAMPQLCTMCDFHDFGITWKCQEMCFGWLHDYPKG